MERSCTATSNRSVTYVEVAKDEELAEELAQPARRGHIAHAGRRMEDAWGPSMRPRRRATKCWAGISIRPTSSGPACCTAECCGRRSIGRSWCRSILAPAKAMDGVVAVQDGEFVGVVAPTAFAAGQAIEAVAKTAKWGDVEMPSSDELYDYLARECRGRRADQSVCRRSGQGRQVAAATYTIAYVQHAPLEPRTAVAEWADGKLTVWTATQNPFGVRGELAQAFRLAEDAVRVDRARFRQRLRRQAHGRIGDRGGPARAGGRRSRSCCAGRARRNSRGRISGRRR